jgi:hypothetical protein
MVAKAFIDKFSCHLHLKSSCIFETKKYQNMEQILENIDAWVREASVSFLWFEKIEFMRVTTESWISICFHEQK